MAPTDMLPEGWKVDEISETGIVSPDKRIVLSNQIDKSAKGIIESSSNLRVEQLTTGLDWESLRDILKDTSDAVSAIIVRTAGINGFKKLFQKDPDVIREARDAGFELGIRAGIGVDNWLAMMCLQEAITLLNTPESNRQSVHKAVISILKALFNPLVRRSRQLRKNQKWGQKPKLWNIAHLDNPFFRDERDLEMGMEPVKLLVVGAGGIGARVCMDAKLLGMDVMYCDTKPTVMVPQCRKVSLEQGMREADVVSVNVSGEEEVITADLLDEFEGVFINTSRGGTVNGAALKRALEEGRIDAGYLDVYPTEGPAAFEDETTKALILNGRMVTTDHNLGYERDAQRWNGKDAANKAVGMLRSGAFMDIYEGPNLPAMIPEVYANGGPSFLLRVINHDISEVHSKVFDAMRGVLRSDLVLGPDQKPFNKGTSLNNRSQLRIPGEGDESLRVDFLMSHLELPKDVTPEILQRVVQAVREVEGVMRARLYRYSKV